MNDLAVYIDISSEHSTGIGSLLGATRIRFGSVGFNYKGAGRQALVYGGDGEDTEARASRNPVSANGTKIKGITVGEIEAIIADE